MPQIPVKLREMQHTLKFVSNTSSQGETVDVKHHFVTLWCLQYLDPNQVFKKMQTVVESFIFFKKKIIFIFLFMLFSIEFPTFDLLTIWFDSNE